MSFLDGVLNDQGPSERVWMAITRDLELRWKAATEGSRFDGYHYKGVADLLLKHGSYFTGREIPEQYRDLRGAESACFLNALEAAERNPHLRYFEGCFTAGFGSPNAHAWCVAPDGGVVEVTMPTLPEELNRYTIARLQNLGRYLPPDRWGYYGASFDVRLVREHYETLDLPMFDRSPAELADEQAQSLGIDVSEVHDFPLLKVPYDPNRTELP